MLSVIHRACQVLISQGILQRKGYKLYVNPDIRSQPPIEGVVYVISYYEEFSRRVGRILVERGINYILLNLPWSLHGNPDDVLRKILAEKPAGIIFWLPAGPQTRRVTLETGGIPMVVYSPSMLHKLNHSVCRTDVRRGIELAVKHLYDLGHRHIAHVSLGRSLDVYCELTEFYREACLNLNLKRSASMIWQSESGETHELKDVMSTGRKKHPEVTALLSEAVVASLAMKIFRVPKELSVIGIHSGAESYLKYKPTPTTVALADPQCIDRWCCSEIIFRIQQHQSGLPAKAPIKTLFVPELSSERSLRALREREIGQDLMEEKAPAAKSWSHLRDSWQKTYPFLKKNDLQNWRQIDLRRHANHSMTRTHGWLGEYPLLHFPPGLRVVHGVPFRVIDESHNGGKAVVTFRSPKTHTGDEKLLPTRERITVGGCFRALYFLHGCGYASAMPFAEYIVHYKSRRQSVIPLIPIGPSRQHALKRLGRLKPNLQDWWPDFPQEDFPHAMHLIVFDPSNPEDYNRYLYTLEWINPKPDREIDSVEVRCDPKAGPALALIAITALL